MSFNSFQKALLLDLNMTGFFLVAVYFHLTVLFPIMYLKKNILLYVASTFLFLVFITYFRVNLVGLIITGGENTRPPDLKAYLYQGFVFFIVISVSTLIKFTIDYLKLREREYSLEKEKLVSELHYLKHQVHPHFLFNTLNSLLYLCEEKSDAAPDVVKKLAELMRYMLEKNKADKTLFTEELQFITAYVELEKIRIPYVHTEIKTAGDIEEKYLPPFVLLPLVENAFKHGINKAEKNNFISVSIVLQKDHGVFTVKNIDRQLSKQPGHGLSNLKKRLDLIYGSKYSFSIQSQDANYIATLKIPYLC